MRTIVGIGIFLVIAGGMTPVAADVELLLVDGRVLKGVEVRLEGGYYLLELDNGEIAAIPSGVVRELHLLDLRPTAEGTTIGVGSDVSRPPSEQDPPSRLIEKRPGWRRGAPQDLAGTPWKLYDTQEQTAVFGEPSRFQPGLPFRFKPVHAWDRSNDVLGRNRSTWQRPLVESVWQPTEAFDTKIDVLASGRSTWSSATRPMRWNPSNSFSRVRADRWWGKDPIGEDGPAGAKTNSGLNWRELIDDCGWCAGVRGQAVPFSETAQNVTAEQCAQRLFAATEDPETLQWAEIEEEPWDDLPFGLHRAWTTNGTRAVFSIAGGTCHLISGDIDRLLGVDISETDALDYAVSAWNLLQAAVPAVVLVTPSQQIDHAFALVDLFESATSGHALARSELLENRAALTRWLGEGSVCSRSSAYHGAQRANAERNFVLPRADSEPEWHDVSFWTWLSRDGAVHAYEVRLFLNGPVALSRESIAEHLGEHEDSR